MLHIRRGTKEEILWTTQYNDRVALYQDNRLTINLPSKAIKAIIMHTLMGFFQIYIYIYNEFLIGK